jgi:hypothetical protein
MDPRITILEDQWKESGEYLDDPRARLLLTIDIVLVSHKEHVEVAPMHLEAYAVVYKTAAGRVVDKFDKDGNERDDAYMHLLDDDADESLERFVGDGGFPHTPVTIAGREYVLVATPHAS